MTSVFPVIVTALTVGHALSREALIRADMREEPTHQNKEHGENKCLRKKKV